MTGTTKHGIAITFPDGKERHFLLSSKKVTIGRGKENAITIPCEAVSTSHCELRRKGAVGSCFEIVDLGSTNGTRLNDEELKTDDSRELRDGDTFMIGLDLKARFFQLQEIADKVQTIEKPSLSEVAGAVTARMQEIHRKPRAEPSINPVAAAVARAERGG